MSLKSEGMPGARKALKLLSYVIELDITPEEVVDVIAHHSVSETTHGLIWGDIANFGRETKGLKLIGLLCRILRDVEGWKADESYPLAYTAANLQKIQEIEA